MVTIKKGDVLTVTDSKSGTSAKGEYFMFKVKAEKGKDAITVWNNTGFTAKDGAQVKVVEIESVTLKNRKFKEQWFKETDAVCKLEMVSNAPTFSEMQDDSSELPF